MKSVEIIFERNLEKTSLLKLTTFQIPKACQTHLLMLTADNYKNNSLDGLI
jgi:hypothetical protein